MCESFSFMAVGFELSVVASCGDKQHRVNIHGQSLAHLYHTHMIWNWIFHPTPRRNLRSAKSQLGELGNRLPSPYKSWDDLIPWTILFQSYVRSDLKTHRWAMPRCLVHRKHKILNDGCLKPLRLRVICSP